MFRNTPRVEQPQQRDNNPHSFLNVFGLSKKKKKTTTTTQGQEESGSGSSSRGGGNNDGFNELMAYLSEGLVVDNSEMFNLVQWWRARALTWPILTRLAMDIFSIPVSIVAAEQAFSTTGRILEERRNALQHDIVEALVCIKDWDRSGQRLHDIISPDMLSEALLCFGANSTSIDEKDTDESSDEICINSIFPEGHDINSCISHAADSIGLKELPRYEVRVGEQYDWIKKTQESFNPVKVAEGLWIVPEWKTPLDLQATNIILNPGLAFGTGEHATTKLCLLLLHGLIKGGEHFLDYGTGSGILAIAALKFGAALSVGTDIDPQAIACARENAALNDIGPEKMHLQLIPETTSPGLRNLCGIPETENLIEVVPETEKFDVVVANILLNPLLDLAGNIVSYAKPGAVVGVSGILSEQVPYIMERYSQFLEGISVSEMDDWACVCGTKKRNVSAAN
ncbi:hypothetical protein L484_009614 [Morus notabilis]|uniref:ETFB lysine methyltransferase n=1 Tax=Morus notabilis TaxID=981085 RepID=W9S1J7_9ROSA|nr:hypothetical protein L484_009614 [Morus notabilis]